MNAFDLMGPLPRTTTLLEASAGTGKTYAIAALAARYIAEEGLGIGQLLLVTFGTHAADELRARVLSRLRSVLEALTSACPADPIASHLAQQGDTGTARRRLRAAVDGFNEATIVTTHSFCHAMLRDLGILGDWDPDEVVGAEAPDLVEQCAVDAYLAAYQNDPHPPFDPGRALRIAHEACTRPLPLLPEGSPEVAFCETVRRTYATRKAAEGICTFDDITARLRDVLHDPVIGETVVSRLRSTYPVVMVDEFQDTDPDQWAIIESAFVDAQRPTVLIGDPKQSIYGFRGADLGSYLQAHRHAQVFTLDRNYRSDPAAVASVTELFGDLCLGDDAIRVTAVESHRATEQLQPPPPGPPGLWIRRIGAIGPSETRSVEHIISDDLAHHVELLCGSAQLPGDDGEPRQVSPSDIAVLVRTGQRARQLRSHLSRWGIPAVLTGNQSVWDQPACAHWEALLRAIADPSQATIKIAALTELLGSPLGALFADSGDELARVSALVRHLTHRFATGGALGVLHELRAHGLQARLLANEDGPRLLADLTHIAELLDETEGSAEQMVARLRLARGNEQFCEPIRLATDEASVRVMTIHAAKGLEFPIVLLPQTDASAPRRTQPFTIIDNARQCLYVGPPPDWRDELARDLSRQHLDEELRLTYVAVTRAKHLTIAWHTPQRTSFVGPLATLLKQHGQPPKAQPRPLNLRHVRVFDFDARAVSPQIPDHATRPREEPLMAAAWQRAVDQTWRRTSYSGLTQGLHDSTVPMVNDESASLDVTEPATEDPSLQIASPMAQLPAGAAFGTLVHEIFERLDWTPTQLPDNARATVTELATAQALDAASVSILTESVIRVATTPLLPLTGSTLSDFPLAHRLAELDFDLPLADHGAPATIGHLASLLDAHLPSEDPFSSYPGRLASSEAADASLNGFLTGSIDAVLQLDNESFVVVDYKTNRLGGTTPCLGHYTVEAMAEAMMQAHYPLQAILYCAALHRFLGARLAGYDPARHLGGVGYLFLRGMAGPDTPVVAGASCGVMAWYPSPELIVAVSRALGGVDA